MENGTTAELQPEEQIKSNGADKSNDSAVTAENGPSPGESTTTPTVKESCDATSEKTSEPVAEPPQSEKASEISENGVEDPLDEDVEMISEEKPAEAIEDSVGPAKETGDSRDKEEDVEEQQSSASSSPSALRIHLDEEDKDESLNGTENEASSAPTTELAGDSDKDADKDADKESPDPGLPMISSVVSLSSLAGAAPDATSEPAGSKRYESSPPPLSPTPSTESTGRNGNTRRTTLRLKRGIEISFDVDKNGQPVSVNHQRNDASAPSASSGASGEPREKRVKVDDEEEDEPNQPDLSELDADGTNTLLAAVQRDIRTLRFMAKQKEKEWNYILKLMKVKEELQAKLMRHREVIKIASGSARKTILPSAAHLQQVVAQSQVHQPAAAASLQTLINQSLSVMMGASNASKPSTSSAQKGEGPNKAHHQPHLSIHQQQQQLQQQAQQQMQSLFQQQQQSKMNPRQRPILPKPSMQIQPDVQIWSQHAHQSNHHHANLVDSALDLQADARNRQGTISVQSLIADYRAKHPEEIPTRGRRVRQPSRICNDPNSSNSPPPGGLQQSPTVDPASNMSFKDVLLQFAKMSSRQGHASPSDLSQMGKDSPGSAGAAGGLLVGAGSAGNSSAAALQSLAAARNARSSPHTASLSAGSILQSALSGAGRATNPSFAPTLAQLLTNPANEQQQPSTAQQHPLALTSSAPVVTLPGAGTQAGSSSSAGAPASVSAAEVLTLSNLLATAKGHVTITSERNDHANDDVTVVGGTSGTPSASASRSQASSGTSGSSANSAGSNYMRTSGGGEVPRCQGCNERVAQFVCAGCSSQWYCSRECQVAAWEEHSEHCVG